MLEALERYWAGRGFDLSASVSNDGSQLLMHVNRAGRPDADWFGFRVKISQPHAPSADEILEGHHALLKRFPWEADNG